MSDRDIRNFFASNGSKSSTNKSNLVKQITLNPKKDIKKITKKEENKVNTEIKEENEISIPNEIITDIKNESESKEKKETEKIEDNNNIQIENKTDNEMKVENNVQENVPKIKVEENLNSPEENKNNEINEIQKENYFIKDYINRIMKYQPKSIKLNIKTKKKII